MGFSYRKRIRTGRRSWLNISKRGVSGSFRLGPFTMNSRGRSSLRLGKGLSYRGGCASMLVVGVGLVGAIVGTIVR
jgi:hypothetical protein